MIVYVIADKPIVKHKELVISVQDRLTNILLLAPADEEHIHKLKDALKQMGYVIFSANSIDAVNDHLSRNHIDAVILNDHSDSPRVLHDIRNKTDAHNPVFCVLTTAESPPSYTQNADIVLPLVSAPFLIRELDKHLYLRQQLNVIQHHQGEINLLKNAIVRNVSHELKTPLLQVKSAVALIAEDMADDKLSRMAVQATARLEAVIKNITLLADSMNGNFGPIRIIDSVEQAIRNLRRIWIHKNATSRIELNIEDDLPLVMSDNQGLSIVMQQLLDNGLKFSKSKVKVIAKRCDKGVYIAVQDEGIGIAKDQLKQIFDSFYQVDSSVTRRYGGTGVGLSIVHIIMNKHGVDIHVDSTLGEGSTFSFVLPEADL